MARRKRTRKTKIGKVGKQEKRSAIVSDWKWFADKIFPTWGDEIGPAAQEHLDRTAGITPKEAVVWAADQLGLGKSDMSSEHGGTQGQ